MPGNEDPRAEGGASTPEVPRVLGRYEVRAHLGEGGMGLVFRAYDPLLDRPVAVKVLHAGSAEMAARFLAEARAQARVSHPNVVKVFEVGTAGERPFIAMQLVEGRPLQEAASGLSPRELAALMRDVAEGVAAAHRIGLVHRDLKPSNVLVEERSDGTLHPYVVDFGLARDLESIGTTKTGNAVGTPAYMAPEQATGERDAIGPRTDVWGLGATLYSLLSGKLPFPGVGPVDTLMKVVHEEPAPLRRAAPGTPGDLATIVGKCLEKDPARRYASAGELARDLSAFVHGEAIAARPPSAIYRLVVRARKHRLALGIAAAALVALAALGGLALRDRLRLRRRVELAREMGAEAQRIEGALRQAHLLPPHDVRPARRQVEERIAALEARTRGLGDVARGPAATALGRALLALGKHEAAVARLTEAWQRGERSGETAWALALAHARRYEEELAALTAVKNPVLREARRADAAARHRDPAAQWLALAAHGEPAEKAYAEALLASLERRWDAAISKAREAFALSEGYYEARLLEAKVETARAADQQHASRPDEARASLGRSLEAAREAIRIGESDPEAYAAVCTAAGVRLAVDLYAAGDVAESHAAAVAACEAVLAIDPDHAPALRRLSTAHRIDGEARVRKGLDPGASLEAALAAARRAVALEPEEPEGHQILGTIRQVQGRAAASSGGDPRARFAEAAESLGRALALRPADASLWNTLGVTHWYRAQWETAHGADPRASLAEAARALGRSTELLPAFSYAWVNLVGVLNDKGGWEASRGLDPGPSLREADAAFRRSLDRIASLADAWNNGGVTWLTAADHAARSDADPRPAAAAALERFGKALEIDPSLFAVRLNRAQVLRFEAEWKVTRGLDPDPGLSRARSELESLPKGETFGGLRLAELGAVLVVGARRDAAAGRSPLPALEAARKVLREALAQDPKLADAHRTRASAALVEARFRKGRGLAAAEALEEARRARETAAALDPGHVELARLAKEQAGLEEMR